MLSFSMFIAFLIAERAINTCISQERFRLQTSDLWQRHRCVCAFNFSSSSHVRFAFIFRHAFCVCFQIAYLLSFDSAMGAAVHSKRYKKYVFTLYELFKVISLYLKKEILRTLHSCQSSQTNIYFYIYRNVFNISCIIEYSFDKLNANLMKI